MEWIAICTIVVVIAAAGVVAVCWAVCVATAVEDPHDPSEPNWERLHEATIGTPATPIWYELEYGPFDGHVFNGPARLTAYSQPLEGQLFCYARVQGTNKLRYHHWHDEHGTVRHVNIRQHK